MTTTSAPGEATLPLPRRALAELLGTGLLVATVVGSGIMAERLAGGNVAVALLANTLATMAGLVALILTFGPVSGAHLNPAVTLADAVTAKRPAVDVIAFIAAQLVGGVLGTLLAHAMFALPLVQVSTHERAGLSQILSEGVATSGLLLVIASVSRSRPLLTPFAVAAWIGAAYWFTASTSFANPAVTVARAFTDTFAGIRPADVPGFLVGQLMGTAVAVGLGRWLFVPAAAGRAKAP